MKRGIFWSVFFTVFLRLQIYKAIAAIFWESASYVLQITFKMERESNENKSSVFSLFFKPKVPKCHACVLIATNCFFDFIKGKLLD